MPLYEYECLKCGVSSPIFRGINEEDPGYQCKDCSEPLSRKFAVGGVQFNGGGFYSTDNKR